MSRLEADNIETMTTDELRELLARKEAAFNQVLRDNQNLVTQNRRLEKDLAKSEGDVEALKKRLKISNDDALAVVEEREVAKKLAATLYEKLTYLSGRNDIKPTDLKKVISLFHAALESVTRITSWPELGQWDFFEQCFAEAERKVLGEKRSSAKTQNLARMGTFLQRSLNKRFRSLTNTPEQREQVRRTIEEFLLLLPRAKVLPGYDVRPVESSDDPYRVVFDIVITDPEWVKAIRDMDGIPT